MVARARIGDAKLINLVLGDCLEKMKEIPDSSVDLIFCDPPYGTTPLNWDIVIPFDKIWQEIKRVSKNNSAILIMGQEPFSSQIRLSNLKDYKYDWYWQKERLTNVFQVKRRPGKVIENVMVFYKDQPIYNPHKTKHEGKLVKNKVGDNARFSEVQGKATKPTNYNDDGTRHPVQVVKISRDKLGKAIHPTQKPVELVEYFINTYTNEGGTVLDFTMGSGTTGVACVNTNRSFIGIEKDETYFNLAKERIENTKLIN